MLLKMTDYHRPETLAEAVSLLRQAGGRARVLAGGTELAGQRDEETEALIDLSLLGLGAVAGSTEGLLIGAMITLKELTAHSEVQGLADGLLARAAHLSAPATIRAAATLGGTLAGVKGGDEVPTALLALGARVRLAGAEALDLPFAEFLARRAELLEGGIVTGVVLPPTVSDNRGGLARVSRSPADRSIVVAAAVIAPDGSTERIAVGGVTAHPQLWPAPDEGAISDLRASGEYRRWVAPILAARAREEALGGMGR